MHSRVDCGGAPTRPTIPTTGPGLFDNSCSVATGPELFYALDPTSGRSKTFVTGAGLMIFFMVNAIGETYFGVQVGHRETTSNSALPEKGYVVLDVILSGSTLDALPQVPDWVFKDDVGGSSFAKWTSGNTYGRILLNNKAGKTAGGMLGPLPAYDFCVDLIIVEASGAVTDASIVNFDSDVASAAPSTPSQFKLGGEFMEEGGMRFCADGCDGTRTNDQETDHSIDCWTKKGIESETLCPFKEINKKKAEDARAAAALANGKSGGNGTTNGTVTGEGDGSGGVAAAVVLLLLCCCCCLLFAMYVYKYRKEEATKWINEQKQKRNAFKLNGKNRKNRKKRKKRKKRGEGGDVEMQNRLPEGWTKEMDEASGQVCYMNHVTGESSWERPKREEETISKTVNPMKRSNHGRDETQLPVGWGKDHDESGAKFYYNEDGVVQWEKPEGCTGGGGGNNGGASLLHERSETHMPSGWEKDQDPESGANYYIDPAGALQWEKPPGNE